MLDSSTKNSTLETDHYKSDGGRDFSSCQELFSRPLPLLVFFFWEGVVGCGELERDIFYCCNLNFDTRHNLNAWNKLQNSNKYYFNFHTVVLPFCQNYTSGKHNQVSAK